MLPDGLAAGENTAEEVGVLPSSGSAERPNAEVMVEAIFDLRKPVSKSGAARPAGFSLISRSGISSSRDAEKLAAD